MKNVLIISPRFPPVNAADHQRVRMALPYFREYGWEPTVLCVDSRFVEASQDAYLLNTIPDDISVESVPAISQALTRKIGFGALSYRAKQTLNRRGKQFAPYTARAMTSQLVNVFDRVLSDRTFRIAS